MKVISDPSQLNCIVHVEVKIGYDKSLTPEENDSRARQIIEKSLSIKWDDAVSVVITPLMHTVKISVKS